MCCQARSGKVFYRVCTAVCIAVCIAVCTAVCVAVCVAVHVVVCDWYCRNATTAECEFERYFAVRVLQRVLLYVV